MKAYVSERGFTLIELGIVIAVIAVLATVVLFGRGFIQAARASKTSEGLDVVRKGANTIAGIQGGVITSSATGTNEMGGVLARGLIPNNPYTTATGFSIHSVVFGNNANATNSVVAISFASPDSQTGLDLRAAAYRDLATAHNNADAFASMPSCTTAAASSSTVVCFNLQ
jgi:prepilin-type N-terminal cleavage/methylation domain-containing protein